MKPPIKVWLQSGIGEWHVQKWEGLPPEGGRVGPLVDAAEIERLKAAVHDLEEMVSARDADRNALARRIAELEAKDRCPECSGNGTRFFALWGMGMCDKCRGTGRYR